ncbi:uncharacterized protein C19orf47 [Battus philenor]|uniref:uncharacterized protein C19orf47 n=1 Tax=Battus philenor TaxID=42288 RepID=UPI0035CF3827
MVNKCVKTINMESNLTSMWVSFFTAAGIPSDVAATYALTFTENRIQNDMLLDLNKEYLRDMGISRMGDVIAILRHAKQVHESTARDKVLNTTSVSTKVPVAAVAGRATVAQPASPASRILEHYTRKAQVSESSPVIALNQKRKFVEISSESEADVKKARLIRFSSSAQPTINSVKQGPIHKQTVFSRLGNSESAMAEPPKVAQKKIYSRLGSKTDGVRRTQSLPIQKDALKYEGILKGNPVVNKVFTVTTTKNNGGRKIAVGTMRADQAPVSVKEKLAFSSPKSVKFSNRVEYKEIRNIRDNRLNTKKFVPKTAPVNIKKKFVTPKPTQVFNKPERRLCMPEGFVGGVKSRLGNGKTKDLTVTRNVFNRLGV